MGNPAARMGDTTAHGGTIVAGAPTVLIGGVPAARANDMHVCPLVNPGTPPPPHVGQQILIGSPTVLICGQMAARMGDQVMCSGPPDVIAMGCFTVLIGESAGGGGGAGLRQAREEHANPGRGAGLRLEGPAQQRRRFAVASGLVQQQTQEILEARIARGALQ